MGRRGRREQAQQPMEKKTKPKKQMETSPELHLRTGIQKGKDSRDESLKPQEMKWKPPELRVLMTLTQFGFES